MVLEPLLQRAWSFSFFLFFLFLSQTAFVSSTNHPPSLVAAVPSNPAHNLMKVNVAAQSILLLNCPSNSRPSTIFLGKLSSLPYSLVWVSSDILMAHSRAPLWQLFNMVKQFPTWIISCGVDKINSFSMPLESGMKLSFHSKTTIKTILFFYLYQNMNWLSIKSIYGRKKLLLRISHFQKALIYWNNFRELNVLNYIYCI